MKNIKKLVLFITMLIVVGGVNVYAANIGTKLTSPEEGWKRYDDNASEIKYTNCDEINYTDNSYNTTYSGISNNSSLIPEINFKFYGSKLRFIGTMASEEYRGKVKIIIDGTEYEFSQVGQPMDTPYNWDVSILQFEKTELSREIHTVKITRDAAYTGKWMLLDAIDIDEDGYLIEQAKVGDQLLEPEAGWRRYDDTDSRFIYQGDFLTANTDNYFNGSIHYLESNPVKEDTKIKFQFLGSKLRIISTIFTDYSKSLVVKVDGKEYSFSEYGTQTAYQILIGEVNNLTFKTHTVEIYSNDNLRYTIDAVDIDDTGELLPLHAPNNLSAQVNDEKIILSWDAVDGADSYSILRSTTSSTIDTVIASGVKETTYIDDNNIEPGVTYYYVVRSVKNGIESSDSNVASAMVEKNTNTAVLQIKLSTTDVYEYRITMNEVDNFMKWYIDRSNGTGLPFYSFSDESKIEPYTDVNEYLIFDKIIWFKVKEYLR